MRFWRCTGWVTGAILGLGGCEPAPLVASASGTEQVVPGPGLPAEVAPQPANNNLDVARFDGRLFLAWRTAPTHFASEDTVMYVVSSDDDGETWAWEATVALGTDVREPNFVAIGDTLHLLFAVLGDNPLDFEPQGTRRITRTAPGDWTAPVEALPVGFIPWRVKAIDGRTHLVGYTGGENIYEPGGAPIEVHWLVTDDAVTWEAAVPGQPIVHVGGGSETDLVILDDGSLVAVMRNEAGDDDGFGSKVCRAPADDLGDWECAPDPKKYDSPLLFVEGGAVWLVGRRNVTDTGAFDLDRDDLSRADQFLTYSGAYWYEPKRCSLWRVDPETLTVAWVLDLDSRGDTCFPEALPEGEGVWTVYNYSNDPEGPDWEWIRGQTQPTNIYRQTLVIEQTGR